MEFDVSRFPRANLYVKSLPQGLDSFPDCKIKREAHEDLIARLAEIGCSEGVPPSIQDVINGKASGAWLPEVVGNTLLVMARDVAFATDERLFNWAKANMQKLASKPLYRMLMHVMSTSLLIIGVAKRWSTFHTGTWLTASAITENNGRHQTTITLTHPPGLYNRLLLEQLTAVYLSVLEAARATSPRAVVKQASDRQAEFVVSWER